ncbi:MAG TPA: hypothetical protein PK691_09950, partial [Thermomicrobiales bacterium]|nr:hypothetical protein [Thermomicrobiales bacterium]
LSAYLLLAAWQFRGWYLLPAILAAAATSTEWRVRMTVWSTCCLIAYWLYIWTQPEFHWTAQYSVRAGTVITFVPIVTMLLMDILGAVIDRMGLRRVTQSAEVA